jgi:hypothetical protein
MLGRLGSGFGLLALADLFQQERLFAAGTSAAASLPHYAARAKSVIWLFMEGGPSAFDLFDPKPELAKNHGKTVPLKYGAFFGSPGPLMRSPFKFAQYGESGTWVCDQLPHMSRIVDDLALIKSCTAESNSHAPAMYQMNTGYTRPGFPSAGSWITYGLGSENRNLPGFVVMPKVSGTKGGTSNWGAGFLPGRFQGTLFRSGDSPILDLKRHESLTDAQQRSQLDLMGQLNLEHLERNPGAEELEARIQSFELAYRMQFEAVDAIDLSQETEATKKLYGVGEEPSDDFGTKCLLARRLVERGVRFIQCYTKEQWDAHGDLKGNHSQCCSLIDKPISGLITDLKQRGLLDSTLVVWGGEFGRLPHTQGADGRDHNPYGFLMWMAGGGIKGGVHFGSTDEIGLDAVENRVTVPDIHATILNQLGLDHKRLTFQHNGRNFRLTDVSGQVIDGILA